MSKRNKKSVGTRRRKNRPNYRNSKKKTLRTKKFRNRKTRRGFARGESDDEEETGIEKLNLPVNAEPDQVEKCPICFDPLNEFTVTTDCNHKFHIECLKPLCKEDNPRCPLCRKNISDTCQLIDYNSSKIMFLFSDYYKKKLKGEQTEDVKNAIKDMLINPVFDPSLPDTREFRYPIKNDNNDSVGVSSLLFFIIVCDNDELTNAYLNLEHPELTDSRLLDVRDRVLQAIIQDHEPILLENYTKTINIMKLVPQKFPNIINIENPLLGITENFTSDKSALLVTFMDRYFQYSDILEQPGTDISLYDRDICINEGKEYKKATLSILSNPNLDLGVINNTPSIETLTLRLFSLIVILGDNTFTNLYLNFMNPYLTNNDLIEVHQFIFNQYDGPKLKLLKKNFKHIINIMKKPPIRQNFPNVTIFDF
jgi:hypothetical protein